MLLAVPFASSITLNFAVSYITYDIAVSYIHKSHLPIAVENEGPTASEIIATN